MPNESHGLSFDLTVHPWIPVQRLNGAEDELSINDVFAQAETLQRIVGDVATQEFALLRLLLAIVVLAVCGGLLWGLIARPADVYSLSLEEQ